MTSKKSLLIMSVMWSSPPSPGQIQNKWSK